MSFPIACHSIALVISDHVCRKQIESLMAKLNESKTSERQLKKSLSDSQQQCSELECKVQEAGDLVRDAHALQNTINHLENRLEIANIEKLDAQEQLCNVQAGRSPFDFSDPKMRIAVADDRTEAQVCHAGSRYDRTSRMLTAPQNMANPHLSMSTVFSSGSPISAEAETQELSTLAAFVAHIERLQDQGRQKDVRIDTLETEADHLQQNYSRLEQDHKANSLQIEIQNELLDRTRHTDVHVEQLRSAIIDREAIIGEKNEAIRIAERQLDHHKLLLQAEIRRRAVLSHGAVSEQIPLSVHGKVAAQSDVDRWIARLNEQLSKERAEMGLSDANETELQCLRREINFYVREIIFYKLDIRGYKSDIKKLKRVTAQLSTYGSRASDLDSETSSLRPAPSPNLHQLSSLSPKLAILDTSSPVLMGLKSNSPRNNDPITPPLSASAANSFRPTMEDRFGMTTKYNPISPNTPAHPLVSNFDAAADEPCPSPRAIAFPSFERRRNVVCKPSVLQSLTV